MSTTIEAPAPPPKSPNTSHHHHHHHRRQSSQQGTMGHSHSHSHSHAHAHANQPYPVSPTHPDSYGQHPVQYPHHQHSPSSPHISSDANHQPTMVYPSHGVVQPVVQSQHGAQIVEAGPAPNSPTAPDKDEGGGKNVMMSRLKRQLWGRQPLSRTWEKQTPPGSPRPQTASYDPEEAGMSS